jgi:hypothetical protein
MTDETPSLLDGCNGRPIEEQKADRKAIKSGVADVKALANAPIINPNALNGGGAENEACH